MEEIEQDQDEGNIQYFVTFSIKSFEGFAILDGGATKTFSGFLSVQSVADQYEDTTIEATDAGFTFVVAKLRHQAQKSEYRTLSSRKEFR